MDRRSFLKSGAGLASAGAVAGLSVAPALAMAEKAPAKPVRWSWEEPLADLPAGVVSDAGTFDIVVVGCGTAGVAAAYAASKNGATVACVEPFYTCSTHGGSIAAVNSDWQIANGFVTDPIEAMEWYRKWSGHKVDQRFFKAFLDNSGHVLNEINAVMAERGVEPMNVTSEPEFPNLTMMHGDFMGGGMLLVGPALMEAAQRDGAQFFFEYTGERLVTDDGGKVTGVIAVDEDGGYIQLNASKGVILATGDYAANPEMIEAWCPMAARADAETHQWLPELDKGEGLVMAMHAGAAMQRIPHCPIVHPVAGGSMQSVKITSLRVDRTGERYGHERPGDMEGCNQRMIVAGNKAWTVIDEKMAYDTINEDVELGYAVKADTIEGLAEAMDVPEDAFVATVARYNDLCDKGADEDFGKSAEEMIALTEAPFYAMQIPASLIVVLGGLNVDYHNRVLDADDDPIEGLYAVGNVAGNFFGNDYPLELSGLSLGRALTQGYMTAEELALA